MSSHGGMAGITITAWFYARYTKTSWAGTATISSPSRRWACFFGRLANFVNGELYGRPTSSPLAMKFPDELNELTNTAAGLEWKFPTGQLRELAAKAGDAAPGLAQKVEAASADAIAAGNDPHFAVVELIQAASRQSPAFRELLGGILTPR